MTKELHQGASSGTLDLVDLSHPLRSIVPSLDADVLEVLAGVAVRQTLLTRLVDRSLDLATAPPPHLCRGLLRPG